MNAGKLILSRGLPKTGQETLCKAGDDGDIQAGWWQGLKLADNRERFAPFTSDEKSLVLDRATGLTWPTDWSDIKFDLGLTGDYNNLFDTWLPAMNAANYGGFSDWRIPNFFELLSLFRFELPSPFLDTNIFTVVQEGIYWTSTTYTGFTDWAMGVNFYALDVFYASKDGNSYRIACRGGL